MWMKKEGDLPKTLFACLRMLKRWKPNQSFIGWPVWGRSVELSSMK